MSTRTTFPPKSDALSGCELSHPVAPLRDGSAPSTGSGVAAYAVGIGDRVAPTMYAVDAFRNVRRLLFLYMSNSIFQLASRCDVDQYASTSTIACANACGASWGKLWPM